jgi:hypothetical protein
MTDEEFEQFITLLDGALASDDPKIRKAIKKFMFIIALNLSDDDCEPGPFTKMMETMDDLQRRLAQVEGQNAFTQSPPYTQTPYTPYVGGGTSTSPNDPFITWYNTTGNITTNAVSTTTVPSTTTTAGNITLTGGSNCTGFTANAYSGMGTNTITTSYDLGYDVDSGTTIKNEIKDKLKKLVSVA